MLILLSIAHFRTKQGLLLPVGCKIIGDSPFELLSEQILFVRAHDTIFCQESISDLDQLVFDLNTALAKHLLIPELLLAISIGDNLTNLFVCCSFINNLVHITLLAL